MVLAVSAADISSAVTFARTWSLDLAVCGGGHASNGASSSDGGLVVDLSQMRAVTVDPSAKTIKAQGGCLWVDVDKAAGEHGLATVGGTVNHTGIGGLTLGGGYGWLSGKHGLVIDNLLAVQIVLADGSIVTASESENSDLFWAVRGAGQAFGVVVEFTFRAHEQRNPVYAGLLVFPPKNLEAFAEAANQIMATTPNENRGFFLGIANPPPAFQPAIVAVLYHNGPKSEAESIFAPLLSLGPIVNTAGVIPYPVLNSMINSTANHGGCKVVKGAAHATPVRPAFFVSLLDDFVAFQKKFPGANALIMLEFLPLDKICSVPHSATAFANRGQYQNVFVAPRFTGPGYDAAGREWAREMASKFQEEMKRRKSEGAVELQMEGVGQYGNYDSQISLFIFLFSLVPFTLLPPFLPSLLSKHQTMTHKPTLTSTTDLNEKGHLIFGSNYDRIIELKRKYDPENLFRKSHVQMLDRDVTHDGALVV